MLESRLVEDVRNPVTRASAVSGITNPVSSVLRVKILYITLGPCEGGKSCPRCLSGYLESDGQKSIDNDHFVPVMLQVLGETGNPETSGK